MYFTRALTLGTVGASLVLGIFIAPAAQAATPAGVASLGSAKVSIAGHATSLAAVAQCSVNGNTTNSTAGPSIAGVVSFGPGHSSCTRNRAARMTTSVATGARFQLDALTHAGGPIIRIAHFQVTCRANTNGAKASWSFSGVTGLGRLPRHVPENYVVSITGTRGWPVAKAILNEVTQSGPNRGDVALNLLHIKLFPNGGPLSGDVVVGHTACTRTY